MVACGSLLAFLAVVSGAFGAHGLEKTLDAYHLKIWHTAASYHMVHALALVLLGLFERQLGRHLFWARWGFLSGIFLFSGSLYALALTGISKLGMITPIGGLSFLMGWVAFAWSGYKAR